MNWLASRQYGEISSRDDAIRGLRFYGLSTCSKASPPSAPLKKRECYVKCYDWE